MTKHFFGYWACALALILAAWPLTLYRRLFSKPATWTPGWLLALCSSYEKSEQTIYDEAGMSDVPAPSRSFAQVGGLTAGYALGSLCVYFQYAWPALLALALALVFGLSGLMANDPVATAVLSVTGVLFGIGAMAGLARARRRINKSRSNDN